MKYLCLLSFLMLIAFSSCKKDDDNNPSGDTRDALFYDGDNQSAPILEAATYDFAVRFPASQMAAYTGRKLEEVKFYILEKPVECEVRIYGENAANVAGALLYSADVLPGVSAGSWNGHTLSAPIELSGEDLWVCVRAKHNSNQRSVGCDGGSAEDNGDWIYASIGTSWLTFRQFTFDQESINWNIRAFLADE